VEIVPPLIEVDFGAVDGRTWAEVERDLPDLAREILTGRQLDWPDGETAAAVTVRVDSVRRLIDALPTPVVIVSHAAILGVLIATLTQSAALGRVALAPGAVLELRREGRMWQPITGRS
jgi:broad specificity phosphatase PhoE